MNRHEQTIVKVNASVDKAIAPVIEQLSRIPNFITEYSCEDNRHDWDIKEGRPPQAYVIFHVNEKDSDEWQPIGEVCNMLAPVLTDIGVSVQLKWRRHFGPIGYLEFLTRDVEQVAEALKSAVDSNFRSQ